MNTDEDISSGFDRSQTTLPEPNYNNNAAARETISTMEKYQFENDLFFSLKFHIDSQNKLVQLYKTRVRSFEKFRKYCQRLTNFGDCSSLVQDKFDLEQFQNEYNKFDKSYRYCGKRIRKLRRKQQQTELSENPYNILYDLYAKIENLDQSNSTKKNHSDRSNYTDQIYPKISINISQPSAPQVVNLVVDNVLEDDSEATQENTLQFNCFVDSCVQKFSTQHELLDHVFAKHSRDEESVDVVTNNRCKTTKGRTTKATKKPATKTKNSRKTKAKSPKKETKTKSSRPTRASTRVLPKSRNLQEKKTEQDNSTSASDLPSEESLPVPKKTKTRKTKKQTSETPIVLRCEVESCEYSTTNSWLLKVHKVTHSTNRPFKCDKCELAFKIKGDLKVHQNVHEGRRFRCTFEGCTVNYATQRRIRKHIKIFHTKEAPLLHCKWEGCAYTTYNSEYLKIHVGVHNGDRPHKCPDCEQAFKSKANLWSHRLKHQNERRYKCTFDGCKYTTYNNVYLQIHRVVHTGERPYKCVWPECGQAFKTSSNLWSHKLMHENERRYKCSFEGCDFAGNLLGNLQKHEETKHGKKGPRGNNQNQNVMSDSISKTEILGLGEIVPNCAAAVQPVVVDQIECGGGGLMGDNQLTTNNLQIL